MNSGIINYIKQILDEDDDIFIYKFSVETSCLGCTSEYKFDEIYSDIKSELIPRAINELKEAELVTNNFSIDNCTFYKKWSKYNKNNNQSNNNQGNTFRNNNNNSLSKDFYRSYGYLIKENDGHLFIEGADAGSISSNYEKKVSTFLEQIFNNSNNNSKKSIRHRMKNAYKILSRQSFYNESTTFLLYYCLEGDSMFFDSQSKTNIIDEKNGIVLSICYINKEDKKCGYAIGIIDTRKPYYEVKTIFIFDEKIELISEKQFPEYNNNEYEFIVNGEISANRANQLKQIPEEQLQKYNSRHRKTLKNRFFSLFKK